MRLAETARVERTPTLTLPRKRERESAAFVTSNFHHIGMRSVYIRTTGLPPSPACGGGLGWGLSSSVAPMTEENKPEWKVPSKLRANARQLRKNSTDAERILWSALRDHRLNGIGFRRQAPIKNYIVDFICHSAKLVIELDGGQHSSDPAEPADAARTNVIEARGFKVLRFGNLEVMTNRDGVLETIAAVAAQAPTLPLPRKREREQELSAGKQSQ